MRKKSKILVIVGPTASGKSDLAVRLAKKFNGEVISADSRQVYRGLNIGAGKITKREMRGVRHHLLDVASPKKKFTVVQYQKLARHALRDILRRGKLPIICGGTGFYIDALLYNWRLPAVPPNPELRRKLEKESPERLFARLEKLDPRRAEMIDRWNIRRLVRALEIVLTTGRPVPPPPANAFIEGLESANILKIGIQLPPEELRRKIHSRLLERMRRGMVAEAKKLHARGLSWKRMEELGLEYRYLARYLQGKITKEAMLAQLEKEIRRYARRQMTWFKRDREIHWLQEPKAAEKLVREFLKQ